MKAAELVVRCLEEEGSSSYSAFRARRTSITGQAGLDRMHKESHQMLDLVGFFRPITKWNAQMRRARIDPEVVRKAFKLAQTEKKGAT